jgi:FtsP/CotA-like multicopper oxidase with cupredoxin domain
MTITRRGLLCGAGALAAGARLVHAGTVDEVTTIRVRRVSAKLMGDQGPQTALWAFGDTWPPPLLRARQGQPFRTRFVNELDREVTLHWFGVRGPANLMSIKIVPGESNALDCNFVPPDAGTFWFGPVADVSLTREMGLYGMLVVEEKDAIPGFADLPLTIDDWRLTNEGAIEPDSFGNLEDMVAQGRMGNWFTVNGAYRPRLETTRGLIRMRLLNAANVRTMALLLRGADPWIIAEDGQPVSPRHVGSEALVLVPGQRVDILIEEGKENIAIALDLFEDVVEIVHIARVGEAGTTVLADNFSLPRNPISSDLKLPGARTVPLVIEGGEKGGMTGASLQGEKLDLRALLEKGYAWAFNGVAGLEGSPWQTFSRGESVILDISNRTAFDQPLHIHGHVWQLLRDDIAGSQPWRDTALIKAKKTAKLAFVADNPGNWGLHSTVAERMDSGLFTSFLVSE